jgi:predicted GNAT superfamily acetyltransferase
LDNFAQGGVYPLYPLQSGASAGSRPPEHFPPLDGRLLLAEIPSDFLALKDADFALARDWRFFSREFFEAAFVAGYLITDYVFDRASESARSFYVLTHGEATLDPSL